MRGVGSQVRDDDEAARESAYAHTRLAKVTTPTGPRDVANGDRWLPWHFEPGFNPDRCVLACYRPTWEDKRKKTDKHHPPPQWYRTGTRTIRFIRPDGRVDYCQAGGEKRRMKGHVPGPWDDPAPLPRPPGNISRPRRMKKP